MTTITEPQFDKLRQYLDVDARMHITAHGHWSLDAGKLHAALEEAGVAVEGAVKPTFTYAVALYGDKAADFVLGEKERLSVHVSRAETPELAVAQAAVERGDGLGTFDQADLLEAGHLLASVERL